MIIFFSECGDGFLIGDGISLLHTTFKSDIADPATGEILLECGQQITGETLASLREKKVPSVSVFSLENSDRAIWEGLMTDKIKTRDEALKEIYKKMRPGAPPTKEAADALKSANVPEWLRTDATKLSGHVVAEPRREQMPSDFNEQLVVEYYSR